MVNYNNIFIRGTIYILGIIISNLIVLIALSIKVLLDSCPSSPSCPLTTLNNGLMFMCTYNSILILIY